MKFEIGDLVYYYEQGYFRVKENLSNGFIKVKYIADTNGMIRDNLYRDSEFLEECFEKADLKHFSYRLEVLQDKMNKLLELSKL